VQANTQIHKEEQLNRFPIKPLIAQETAILRIQQLISLEAQLIKLIRHYKTMLNNHPLTMPLLEGMENI